MLALRAVSAGRGPWIRVRQTPWAQEFGGVPSNTCVAARANRQPFHSTQRAPTALTLRQVTASAGGVQSQGPPPRDSCVVGERRGALRFHKHCFFFLHIYQYQHICCSCSTTTSSPPLHIPLGSSSSFTFLHHASDCQTHASGPGDSRPATMKGEELSGAGADAPVGRSEQPGAPASQHHGATSFSSH